MAVMTRWTCQKCHGDGMFMDNTNTAWMIVCDCQVGRSKREWLRLDAEERRKVLADRKRRRKKREPVRYGVNPYEQLAEPANPSRPSRGRRPFRKRIRRRLEERKGEASRATATPAPRYDEVFFDGVRWLDQLAGEAEAGAQAEGAKGEGDGMKRDRKVYVYVWVNGNGKAPLILTYLTPQHRSPEDKSLYKVFTINADSGRTAKQEAEKLARAELKHDSGLWNDMLNSEREFAFVDFLQASLRVAIVRVLEDEM